MTCPRCGTETRSGGSSAPSAGQSSSWPAQPVEARIPRARSSAGSVAAPSRRRRPTTCLSLRSTPEAERRLVSVLFADLVGFTTLSEGRDAEEVRELLSRYFDTARRVIGRYGGTVEKFIGDAVMAVWGAPIAQEDDAERAVRAGARPGRARSRPSAPTPASRPPLRAGVVTGEAAVTVGAEGQGMVAGDLVNTARACSPRRAGHRARRRSDARADGRPRSRTTTPASTSSRARPSRCTSGARARRRGRVGGEGRSGLEAPFVGREARAPSGQGALPRERRRARSASCR